MATYSIHVQTEDALRAVLFSGEDENTYAIVDGASCEDLLDKFAVFAPERFCLFAGHLEPDIEEIAPYLVALEADHPFTEWYLAHGFGLHWGIFALGRGDLRAMRKHFRTFLKVKDPDGEMLYFRYYDPRVLSLYLPTANEHELETVFGKVTRFVCETGKNEFHTYHLHDGELVAKQHP